MKSKDEIMKGLDADARLLRLDRDRVNKRSRDLFAKVKDFLDKNKLMTNDEKIEFINKIYEDGVDDVIRYYLTNTYING